MCVFAGAALFLSVGPTPQKTNSSVVLVCGETDNILRNALCRFVITDFYWSDVESHLYCSETEPQWRPFIGRLMVYLCVKSLHLHFCVLLLLLCTSELLHYLLLVSTVNVCYLTGILLVFIYFVVVCVCILIILIFYT